MGRMPFRIAAGVVAMLTSLPGLAEVASPQQASAAIRKYCASCHSAQVHTAGLVLDPAAVSHVQTDAERWEKAIRKLRANAMPPPGAPRPDQATLDSLSGFLETELDKAAAARPNAGRLPLLHRLSRTEYQNAVRDLLALDALPKEMDYSMLLPPDNANSGFDNIADLLFISPTAMESYLGAAEKISRLAVGDRAAPEMVNIYRVPDEQPQTAHVDGLPLGTRGGLAVRSHFPLDGEYLIKATFAGRSDQQQQLEITVDGERVEVATIAAVQGGGRGGKGAGRASRGRDGQGDLPVAIKPVEIRIPVKAGPRLIGVSFLERNEVRDEEVLRPRMRGVGPELGVDVVTISGPFNAKGPG